MKGCARWQPKKKGASNLITPVFGAADAAPFSPGASYLLPISSERSATAFYSMTLPKILQH